jgi:hypothetical protein
LTYFYDHHEAMIEGMNAVDDAARREAPKQAISRAELLRRRMIRGS